MNLEHLPASSMIDLENVDGSGITGILRQAWRNPGRADMGDRGGEGGGGGLVVMKTRVEMEEEDWE
jgi:GTPase involved in cell partitioning and DNA repair